VSPTSVQAYIDERMHRRWIVLFSASKRDHPSDQSWTHWSIHSSLPSLRPIKYLLLCVSISYELLLQFQLGHREVQTSHQQLSYVGTRLSRLMRNGFQMCTPSLTNPMANLAILSHKPAKHTAKSKFQKSRTHAVPTA